MSTDTFFTPSLQAATADSARVFTYPMVRFTLLTARMIRIEISPDGRFEDRPTQTFWYRHQPPPPAEIRAGAGSLSLETAYFRLDWRSTGKRFSPRSLRVTVRETGAVFHLDDPNPGRLPGTARTLDQSNGPVKLQPGIISRAGWVQLDDTPGLVFNSEGWLEPRPAQPGYRDLYLLISGTDYKSALQDYQRISGLPGLIPRTFLGNWWSRYWEYSQQEVQELVERFHQEEIPLSVFILDMDWHITETGNDCSGWTGFTWNRRLFPQPEKLIDWLHDHRLITSLNLHPAEGIHPHEERYPQAARALGIDPASQTPIPFDIADPAFTRVYFEQLLHPLEEQGVDFWWLDWQQGQQSKLTGLDPLWWLNHLHYYDLVRDGKKRPVIFSRWGGAGNQRYPIGFSGDTVVSWQSLAFQPYFTAAAANVGYGWWSHDIGGHMSGREDAELYTRWVQFGALSPIFRLHCTKNPFIDRQPWAFGAEVLRLTRQTMQFRHALVPYLYTMARRNQVEGLPLITPLYYDWPAGENAYLVGSQYLLGSALMAAPVTAPRDPELNQTRQVIWFPPGEWFDFFTGAHFSGPQWRIEYYALEDIPLFARAGALLPLQADVTENGCSNPRSLDLIVFPGANGEFELYEDDGVTQQYLQNGGCLTLIQSTWTDTGCTVHIHPARGDTEVLPAARSWRVRFRGIRQPDGYNAFLAGQPVNLPAAYDPASRTLTLGPVLAGIDQSLQIELRNRERSLLAPEAPVDAAVMRLLKLARIDTDVKWGISQRLEDIKRDISVLKDARPYLTDSQWTALIEIITGAGAAEIQSPQYQPRVVLVNPKGLPGFKCRGAGKLRIDRAGVLAPEKHAPLLVDYFGLVKKKF